LAGRKFSDAWNGNCFCWKYPRSGVHFIRHRSLPARPRIGANGRGYPSGQRDRDSIAGLNYSNANPDAHSNTDAHSHSDAYSNTNPHSDADSNPDADSNRDAHADTVGTAFTHTGAIHSRSGVDCDASISPGQSPKAFWEILLIPIF
jgi:hypothetical protein